MQLKVLGVVAVCGVFLALPIQAHHSHQNYAISDLIVLEGNVTEMHLINPHSWVYIEVKDAQGTAQLWALEATSRAGLERIGVTKEYIKAGDTIKARCHPLRDGSNGCLLGFLKARDGSVKDWDGGKDVPVLADF
jgi:hypothetical protein